jgi:hypothetical protein
MSANNNPDLLALLPSSRSGDFEAFVRHALSLIITKLDRIESQKPDLKINLEQLNRDEHDRYVDLRMRLIALDEKMDAHLREVVIPNSSTSCQS